MYLMPKKYQAVNKGSPSNLIHLTIDYTKLQMKSVNYSQIDRLIRISANDNYDLVFFSNKLQSEKAPIEFANIRNSISIPTVTLSLETKYHALLSSVKKILHQESTKLPRPCSKTFIKT